MPALHVDQNWEKILGNEQRARLEASLLPQYLRARRWFGGKARRLERVEVIEEIPIGEEDRAARLLLLRAHYAEGAPEIYVLPLAYADRDKCGTLKAEFPDAIVSGLEGTDERGCLYDGVYDEAFRHGLLMAISENRTIAGREGDLLAYRGSAFAKEGFAGSLPPGSTVLKAEQSNTSMIFGKQLFFKLYRHVDEGVNPDLEITRFLTEAAHFAYVPDFVGGLEYRKADGKLFSLGILQAYVPSRGDCWSYLLEAVKAYYRRVLSGGPEGGEIPAAPGLLAGLLHKGVPSWSGDLLAEEPVALMTLLGKRTAELHRALASSTDDPEFTPEPFALPFQESVFESMAQLVKRVLRLLEDNRHRLTQEAQSTAKEVLALEQKIMENLHRFSEREIAAVRIRIHGDYHLGQVLISADDIVILDFEGEPARSLTERRMKHSALKDVAGMLRSFEYAAYLSLFQERGLDPGDRVRLLPWADFWSRRMGAIFLAAYRRVVEGSNVAPGDASQLEIMLRAFLLEKAVYELGYELNNRPEWVFVPLRGIHHLLMEER